MQLGGRALETWDDSQHPIVMRYRPDHKAEVHHKIVKDASRRVRSEGLNGAAVAAVMRGAGLTHGGFYRHFGCMDELLMESSEREFPGIHEHPGSCP